ncbi:DNA repair protein rad9 [Pseudocercospora fuligena]|uniref:DNA repair protein rad9 n=1 Tax=Pseudocercospora fuligena TaxID=685502 RepID=A0A8H6VMK3_9PEZI|nr:DNA repair protein rad9 [Pseudocercospora fuligena]
MAKKRLTNDTSEVLKQPLETAIAIHTEDFEDFHMQEGMHIIISVKDFRAIVTHAETLRGPIHAYFSYPNRPLQFSYQNHGIHCEFTLMTTGDRGASASSSSSAPKFVSTRPNGTSSRQPSAVPSQRNGRSTPEMPPPGRPSAGRPLASQSQRMAARDRPRPTAITVEDDDPDPESLFVPTAGGDDDQTWDPPNYDQDEDEMLGWDASNDNFSASIRPTIRDLSSQNRPSMSRDTSMPSHESGPYSQNTASGLAPTQRLSQVRTMMLMADAIYHTLVLFGRLTNLQLHGMFD